MVVLEINKEDSSIVYKEYNDIVWVREKEGFDRCDEECGESDY